jgi:hypothetical protein
MSPESQRTCPSCGNELSGAMEFCLVCMLRKGLAKLASLLRRERLLSILVGGSVAQGTTTFIIQKRYGNGLKKILEKLMRPSETKYS